MTSRQTKMADGEVQPLPQSPLFPHPTHICAQLPHTILLEFPFSQNSTSFLIFICRLNYMEYKIFIIVVSKCNLILLWFYIFRLERCKSREGANLEYLKNVVLSYLLSTDSSCKAHMLNAIAAVLKFSDSEQQTITQTSWYRKTSSS